MSIHDEGVLDASALAALAATAATNGLPLFTANDDDLKGLEDLLSVVAVRRADVRLRRDERGSAARWPVDGWLDRRPTR